MAAEDNQVAGSGDHIEHFSRPNGFKGWADDFFKWAMRNLGFGGFLIITGVVIARFAAVPDLENSGYYTYATILSVVVLSISALFVNTDFDPMSMKFMSQRVYYVNVVAKFLLLVGFGMVLFLTPSTVVNIKLFDRGWLDLANLAIFFLSAAVAYTGHCIQLRAREIAYKESARAYNENVDDVSQIEQEASKRTEVDGVKV